MNSIVDNISNPMLVGAMELLKKNKSAENLKVFMDELSHARLISPVVITPPPVADENGNIKLTKENKISISLVPGPDDKKYFMAFTDMDELGKINAKSPVAVLPFGVRNYAAIMENMDDKCGGIVINPVSNGPIVNRAMIAAIMSKSAKKSVNNSAEQDASHSEE